MKKVWVCELTSQARSASFQHVLYLAYSYKPVISRLNVTDDFYRNVNNLHNINLLGQEISAHYLQGCSLKTYLVLKQHG